MIATRNSIDTLKDHKSSYQKNKFQFLFTDPALIFFCFFDP